MGRLHLLFALSALAKSGIAYGTRATIELYAASELSESTANLTAQDCGEDRTKTTLDVAAGTCVWGDYNLVNNLKIVHSPWCHNGGTPVLQMFESTSCTGNPTFDSSQQSDFDFVDRCLFGSSPKQWSMIIRCNDYKSQRVERYTQAIPSKLKDSPAERAKFVASLPASEAVVIPHTSYDCTVWKPKEPTFLPTNTCIHLPSFRSVMVVKPAMCSGGKPAKAVIYDDANCALLPRLIGLPGLGGAAYHDAIAKTCERTEGADTSMAFLCDEDLKDGDTLKKFDTLPPHEHKKVQPLKVLPAYVKPEEDEEVPEKDKEPAQKPIKKGSGAVYLPHDRIGCRDDRPHPLIVRPVDVCVPTTGWKSLSVRQRGICSNGTDAFFATFDNAYCEPQGSLSFGDLPAKFLKSCPDIEEVQSIAFVCKGVKPLRNPNRGSSGSAWGLVKFLLIVGGILLLMTLLTVLSCVLKGARLMDQLNRIFGQRDGSIRL